MYATSQVFQHKDNSRVTPCSNTNTNNNGGRREMCIFLAENSHFEFSSAKDENIKVRCTLCAGEVLSSFKNTTSNLKKHLEWQHS